MFIEWLLIGPLNTNEHLPRVSVATEDSHARFQKVWSGCTTIRRIRQLVYKDNWSTTTVCQMRHLVYSFFYLPHLVEKMFNFRC